MEMLKQGIRNIKGIGDKIENHFKETEIFTYRDLLEYYPKKYTLYEIVDLKAINSQTRVTVIAFISTPVICQKYKRGVDVLTFSANTDGKIIRVAVFGKSYLRFGLKIGMRVVIHGVYKPYTKELIAQNIFTELFQTKIEVDYKLDVSNSRMQNFVKRCLLEINDEEIPDDIPEHLLLKYRLLKKKDLIKCAHFPNNKKDLHEVSRRLKYENFLNYSLSLEALKYNKNNSVKIKKVFDKTKIEDYIKTLPFELTIDQKEVIDVVLNELASTKTLNRLIQGDVGCGKSIVALIAAYATTLSSFQVVFMAPTEILANQHYHYFVKELGKYKVVVELLSRNVRHARRVDILERLRTGRIHILIGTQALLTENVNFNRLGLAIIDEQHRFGVEERTTLVNKCPNTDAIFLTATPIPRTLGLTSFGDLDLSAIKTMPVGRKQVITKVIKESDIQNLLDKMRNSISNKEQIYVVVPLIEENELFDFYDTEEAFNLIKFSLPEARVGKIHGRLKSSEKDEIMGLFKNKQLDILVSTTVIEVGLDIKNATMMVIFNAERFGLSQIHQLRGRVGRGDVQSYCFLVSDFQNCERLEIMENCNDGFSLSDADFRLRGPGDYLGERQTGFFHSDIVDFNMDSKIWDVARKDAKELFDKYSKNEAFYPIVRNIVTRLNKKSIKLN